MNIPLIIDLICYIIFYKNKKSNKPKYWWRDWDW